MTKAAAPRRPGIALIVAIYFLALLGALVVAVFYAVARNHDAIQARLGDAVLTAGADYALGSELLSWPFAVRAQQPPGAADTFPVVVPSSAPVAGSVRTTRLTETLYWIVSDLQSPLVPGSARRTNLLVRIPPLTTVANWAIVSAGDVYLGPAVQLSQDQPGAVGSCLPYATGNGAVAVAAGAKLKLGSGRAPGNGVAELTVAAAGDPSTYSAFGSVDWDSLAARAPLQIRPGGSVQTGAANLVYAAGDATLTGAGGGGKGVLLVEGRLQLAGPLSWSGVIVARGGVETIADGVTLEGVILSGAHNGDSSLAGKYPASFNNVAQLRGSRCLAQRAYAMVSRPRPVRDRAYGELW